MSGRLECCGGPFDGEDLDLEGKSFVLVAWDGYRGTLVSAPLNALSEANEPFQTCATGQYVPEKRGEEIVLRWIPQALLEEAEPFP